MVCGPLSNFPRIVQIVFFVGNMIGVLLIGPFSDWYGRKTAYMTALTIWSIVTIIGYFLDNPYAWLTTRFLAGACSLAYNTAADVYRYLNGIFVKTWDHFHSTVQWSNWFWLAFLVIRYSIGQSCRFPVYKNNGSRCFHGKKMKIWVCLFIETWAYASNRRFHEIRNTPYKSVINF